MANYVKFQRGSQKAYDLLVTNGKIDPNTLYFIYPEDNGTVGKLYMGERLISGGDVVLAAANINDLADVITANVKTNDFLVAKVTTTKNEDGADVTTTTWENKTLADIAILIKESMGEIAAPANVFWTVKTVDDVNEEAAAKRVAEASGKTLAAGDIAIVKTLIHGDKYQHTAFVYDGSNNWAAMDGNYNAENVYFDEDITVTTAVGNISLSNGAGTIPAAGKNLKQVFEAMYTKEDLTITTSKPTISFALDKTSASGEVGETFTRPTATLQVTGLGSYEYGSLDENGAAKGSSTTGITFDSLKVCFGADHTITDASKIAEITDKGYVKDAKVQLASSSLITDNELKDTSASYKFSAIAKHTASPYAPKTNLGNMLSAGTWSGNDFKGTATTNNYDEAKGFISSNDNMTPNDLTFTASGYRKWFMYIGKDHTTAIDSAFIRDKATSKGNGANASTQTEVTIPDGTTRIVIAIPKAISGAAYSYGKTLGEVIDVDGMGLPVTGNFNLSTVSVKGANNYAETPYNVWVCENPNGIAATRYTFNIS